MTPEEFRDRATAAVAPIEPSALSYALLRENIARRRRRARVVVAAVGATAVVAAAGIAYAAGARPEAAPPVTGQPAPPPLAPHETAAVSDVDGDGKPDNVGLLTSDRGVDRWGVEADLTGSGTTKRVWLPGRPGAGRALSLAGTVDMDLDGDAEIVVRIYELPERGSSEYVVVSFYRGQLRVLERLGRPLLTEEWEGGYTAWGCAEVDANTAAHDVYVVTVSTANGRRTGSLSVYHLKPGRWEGGWADGSSRATMEWALTDPTPPEFDQPFTCGNLTTLRRGGG